MKSNWPQTSIAVNEHHDQLESPKKWERNINLFYKTRIKQKKTWVIPVTPSKNSEAKSIAIPIKYFPSSIPLSALCGLFDIFIWVRKWNDSFIIIWILFHSWSMQHRLSSATQLLLLIWELSFLLNWKSLSQEQARS